MSLETLAPICRNQLEAFHRSGAVVGVGVDLLDARRVERICESHPDRFAKRLLSQGEWNWWVARGRVNKDLAKQFAAKEAVAKSLGTGIAKGVTFHQIQVYRDAWGAPYVELVGKASEQLQRLGAQSVKLSLSDEDCWVIAIACCQRLV